MKLTDRLDLMPAAQLIAKACKASKIHSRLAETYLQRFGDHGSLISGCVRDHFPEYAKNNLRRYARLVTEYSDAAYAARPKRVRIATMRKLSREIASEIGHGFYGPQP